MPLKPAKVLEQFKFLHGIHTSERDRLDVVRRYWKGRQKLPAVIPAGTPNEVNVMARSSRVNIMPIVVNSLVQSTFVEGFRTKGSADDEAIWAVWQANRMDARQTAIHRAAYGYGTAYAVVLPGDPEPVIRGVSPRSMTAVYGEDPDWPMMALERLGKGLWRLFDEEASYYVSLNTATDRAEFISSEIHDVGVTPVVRFLDEDDLDDGDEVEPERQALDRNPPSARGQVAPLMPLQDQIDMTTFGLQIAQHYSAFRQRWIVGWVGESEAKTAKVGASRMLAFEDDPESIKLGEFEQTNLDGYIKSREASLRHAATLSQTPVHELIGELVNMSAEALAAAEAGRDRKVDERKTLLGESHEQVMWVAGRIKGVDVPADAEVKWRDTSARAFAATVDGLGKIATMLNVPSEMLWERIPDTTKQDIQRWREAARQGDSFQDLVDVLNRQAA
ncbi:MAG: phage portal protein [Acidimicrobiia bacterium]|nr:phage portal protein [Acidimicrobiia bacterium]